MDLDSVAFVVIDVETTGFVPGVDRVVEVAAVLVDPGQPPRVGLDTVIHAESTGQRSFAIHRIPEALARQAPTLAEVAPTLLRCLAGRVVVGHNLSFDLRHLRAELALVDLALPEAHASVDTMHLDRILGAAQGSAGRRTLDAACAAWGIRRGGGHSAGIDAVDTARLLQTLLGVTRGPPHGVRTLEGLQAILGGPPAPVLPADLAQAAAGAPSEPLSRYVEEHGERIAMQEYGQLLAMALTEPHLTEEEAASLMHFRATRGLDTEQVRALHAQAFAAAILMFCQDARIDSTEAAYLAQLRRALVVAGWCPGDADSAGPVEPLTSAR